MEAQAIALPLGNIACVEDGMATVYHVLVHRNRHQRRVFDNAPENRAIESEEIEGTPWQLALHGLKGILDIHYLRSNGPWWRTRPG